MSIRTRLTFFIQKANASFSACQSAKLGRVVSRRPLLGASCSEQQQQAQVQQQQHQPQRAEFSTLRRGPTGPMSARARLPMRGLEEFRDPHPVKAGDTPIVGRPWTVPELRKKSFEDLHKLWFVLYKEKNMLMTELAISRRTKAPLPAGDRRQKVKRSMKAIKVVVGERQRLKRSIRHEKQVAVKRQEWEAQRAALALEEEKQMSDSVDVSTTEKVDSNVT